MAWGLDMRFLWAEKGKRKLGAQTKAIDSVAYPFWLPPAFGRAVWAFGPVFYGTRKRVPFRVARPFTFYGTCKRVCPSVWHELLTLANSGVLLLAVGKKRERLRSG